MDALRSFHTHFGFWVVGLNALAGIAALVAWQWKAARGKWLWIAVGVAEIAVLLQILIGVVMVSSGDYANDGEFSGKLKFHMFYGFVSFVVIGLMYAYRKSLTGRLELAYGLAGCFLAGLAVRAILQVV